MHQLRLQLPERQAKTRRRRSSGKIRQLQIRLRQGNVLLVCGILCYFIGKVEFGSFETFDALVERAFSCLGSFGCSSYTPGSACCCSLYPEDRGG